MKSDLVDIDVIFQTQTELAVCVRTDEKSKKDIWLPKSACEFEGSVKPARRGDVVELTASEKLLTEKGLI